MPLRGKWLIWIVGLPVVASGLLFVAKRFVKDSSRPATYGAFSCAGVAQYISGNQTVAPDKRIDLRSRVQPKKELDGGLVMTRANVNALMRLAIVRDQDSAPLLKEVVRRSWRGKSQFRFNFAYIWAIFWIEHEKSVPFLIECLAEGDESAYPALACLARLAFHHEPFEDLAQASDHWNRWWQTNEGVTWDEHFRNILGMLDVNLVDFATVEDIPTEVLVSLSERFPLTPSPVLRIQELSDLPRREDLVAMRVSEVLCARTGIVVSPPFFPFGHPDRSMKLGPDKEWRGVISKSK